MNNKRYNLTDKMYPRDEIFLSFENTARDGRNMQIVIDRSILFLEMDTQPIVFRYYTHIYKKLIHKIKNI